jgi:N-acyl-phosphatidylethanolamine-hydrolysing phospholipase D
MPPSHHTLTGFRNPWPGAEPHGFADFLRWAVVDRMRERRPADPPASVFVRVTPDFPTPRAASDQLVVTWVGHTTLLLQIGGQNLLVDPVWSERASPVQFAGPKRWVPPGIDFDALPPIDGVLVSHDHYDHLDAPTIARLVRRWPDVRWLAPLRVGEWLRRRGARTVSEWDWWQAGTLGGPSLGASPLGGPSLGGPSRVGERGGPPTGTIVPDERNASPSGRAHDRPSAATELRIGCVPAQHFSGRRIGNRNTTLWCGWTIRSAAHAVYFAADTALHPEFSEIAARFGPFDLALLPIGAYEPRWFMRAVHMNPEDALAAYRDLARANGGRRLVLGGTHFGTFKLTDEPMDEPPRRMRALWVDAGLPADDLWVPRHGETRKS